MSRYLVQIHRAVYEDHRDPEEVAVSDALKLYPLRVQFHLVPIRDILPCSVGVVDVSRDLFEDPTARDDVAGGQRGGDQALTRNGVSR